MVDGTAQQRRLIAQWDSASLPATSGKLLRVMSGSRSIAMVITGAISSRREASAPRSISRPASLLATHRCVPDGCSAATGSCFAQRAGAARTRRAGGHGAARALRCACSRCIPSVAGALRPQRPACAEAEAEGQAQATGTPYPPRRSCCHEPAAVALARALRRRLLSARRGLLPPD